MKVTGSKAIRTALLAFLMISGCLFDGDDGPKYPPLKMEELAGCWFLAYPPPPTWGGVCSEFCFSLDSLFYSPTFQVSTPSVEDVVEWYGSYSISKNNPNELALNFTEAQYGKTPYSSGNLDREYYIQGDTLYRVTKSGTRKFIHSDSLHSCRPHWWFFEKPEGWDLD